MEYREVEGLWDLIRDENWSDIVVTGWAGYRHLYEDVPVWDRDRVDRVTGYAVDPEAIEVPWTPGGQTLTFIQVDELPDYSTKTDVQVATPDTLIPDLVDGNVRRFRNRYDQDPDFRNWIRGDAGTSTHAYLLDELGDDHFIGNQLREDLESERSE